MTAAQVESRLSALEQEVARLKAQVAMAPSRAHNWVEAIAGTFADDPIFEDAMRLGRKWRQAQRPRGRHTRSSHGSSMRHGAAR
jgi:hypothetical protein